MSIFSRSPSQPVLTVQEIQSMLTKKLADALVPHGFKRKSSTFYREHGKLTHIINLQGDKWNEGTNGTYYIKLAVYYSEAASIENGDESPAIPKEYDGQLRGRIDHPSEWKFSPLNDSAKVADSLIQAVLEQGVPYFDNIDTPAQLADCIMNKKKDHMIMVTGHISRAVIFSLLGQQERAQKEFDLYFKKNTLIKGTDPIDMSIKRHYMCVAQKAGLKLDLPELDGESCVGFYLTMSGARFINDERRAKGKLELFLYNLEKKGLGYTFHYGSLRKPGAYRIGFCTKNPDFVASYIKERADKFPIPLQAIITHDNF